MDIKERARQVALARQWLDEQKILTVERRYHKDVQQERFHLALKDANGDHLLNSERAHWAWYEGTLEHRNSVADRIAELLIDYSASAMTEAADAARLEEALAWSTPYDSPIMKARIAELQSRCSGAKKEPA